MKLLILSDPVLSDPERYQTTNLDCLARLVQAALQLGGEISVLIADAERPHSLEQYTALTGVKEIIVVEHAALAGGNAENYATLLTELATDFSHIIAAASTFGTNIIPRIAALLDVTAVTGVTEVVDKNIFVRPVQAGNALATVEVLGKPICLTLRSSEFAAVASEMQTRAVVHHMTPSVNLDLQQSRLLEVMAAPDHGRPPLTSAHTVVAGGGGVQRSEDFLLIETLADELGAAIGASRAAVDADLAPSAWQIGQTAHIIAPELYVGIGISGALQHLAGIKGAKTVVAINNDPSAPLLTVADFALQADLYQAVPELIKQLQKRSLSL